jgi:signal transduction histidine kinase
MPIGRMARYVYRWGAVALAGLGVVQILIVPPKNSVPVAYVAAVAIGVGIWFLPRRPIRVAWGLAIAVAAMAFAIGTPVLATYLGAMAAVFTLSRYVKSRNVWWGYLAIVAATAAMAMPQNSPGQDSVLGLLYPLGYLGGAWALGWIGRRRAVYVQKMRDYAAALERDQTQKTALAAAAERVRIARELHDSISTRVGLIVVEAEAAREALRRQPEHAALALDGVSAAGRQVINDLRQMSGVLRDPMSSLDLYDLVEPARTAGVTVDLVQDGDDSTLQSRVRSAVYRIVQEALANTLRHASATYARVTVHYEAASVDLEIIDNSAVSKAEATAVSGHGFDGLRDHILEINGEVSIGARPDGPGFRVWASLPTAGPALTGEIIVQDHPLWTAATAPSNLAAS